MDNASATFTVGGDGGNIQIYSIVVEYANGSAGHSDFTTLVYVPKNLSATGYATFSAPYNVVIPEGIDVYCAKINDACTSVSLIESESEQSIIPANTGVILHSSDKPANVELLYTSKEGTMVTDGNQLVATSIVENQTIPSDVLCYGLKASMAEFAKINAGTTVSEYKAYIKTEINANEHAAKELTISFGDDDMTTAIVSPEKAVHGNAAIYNLAGQRVSRTQNGIYIINGKKVVK